MLCSLTWDGDGGWGVSTKNTYYKDCSLPPSFLLAAAVTGSISFSSWVTKRRPTSPLEQVSDAAKPYRIYYLWRNPADCALPLKAESRTSSLLSDYLPERIGLFIEDQAFFFGRIIRLHAHPLPLLSREQIVSLSQSSCGSHLTDGRGGGVEPNFTTTRKPGSL